METDHDGRPSPDATVKAKGASYRSFGPKRPEF